MADIHKLSVQEALNSAGSGGQWTASTSGTAGSVAADSNTIHFTILGTTAQLGIYSDVDIRFKFTTGATDDIDVSEDDELILPAQSLTFITVPRGLGSTIYFNHLGVATTTVRTVEV